MSPQKRLALTIVIMGATLMQVLDTTIANVALPHMQASLGAAPDTISWVLTSYIIAAAIATPVTGWVEARIGRRALLIFSLGGFTLASIACGLSTSLAMMVVARLVQGLCGAFISPLSQAIMLDIYPENERAKAMMIWGMGVMIGPIMGPVIGGLLTDAYDWRWVFFINVPVGVLSLVGTVLLLPNVKMPRLPFDVVGFGLLAVGLSSLQLVLDRGSQLDWFDSSEILIEAGISGAFFWMFAIHTATSRNPLIPLALFRDRNFVVSNVFVIFVMGVIMSGAALIPPMLQGLYGYDTTQAGLLIVPRGAAMMLSMYLSGKLANWVDPRLLIAFGMMAVGVAQWQMTGFSPEMDSWPIIVTGGLQGLGFGFVMLPLNLIAFATIPPTSRTSGAAIYNLSRNIGGSVSIAIFSAIFTHNIQVSHSDLAGAMSTIRYPFLESGLAEKMGVNGSVILEMINREVNLQATMISYLDDFWLMAIVSFAFVPVTFFLRSSKEKPSPEMMAME